MSDVEVTGSSPMQPPAKLPARVWSVTRNAFHEFVWADLKDGLVDLHDLPRLQRFLILLGFVLLFVLIGALLYNDFWRTLFPLSSLVQIVPGRGSFIPTGLVPFSLFLFVLACAYMLAGALHSHPALRVGVLLVFVCISFLWAIGSSGLGAGGFLVILVSNLVLVLFSLLRWRARPRPVVEFAIILGLLAVQFSVSQALALNQDRQTGLPLSMASLQSNLQVLSSLVIPLLFLIGMDMVQFARRAAGWTAGIAREHLPYMGLLVLLAGGGILRLATVLPELVTSLQVNGLQSTALSYLGALILLALVWLAWFLVARGHSLDISAGFDALGRPVFLLILAYSATGLIGFGALILAMGAAGFAGVLDLLRPGLFQTVMNLLNTFMAASDWLTAQTPNWRLLLAGLALGGGLLAARRRPVLALYLAAFGLHALWLILTNPGKPFHALYWRGDSPVDFWLVLLLAGAGLRWAVRRTLTPGRAAGLLFLLCLTGLIRQTDFIGNRFSPLFASAGLGFLAFGLVWDALTIGTWANQDTPALPRVSRLFLYVGYVLLTVMLINWNLATHNLDGVSQLSGSVALHGFEVFGLPLLYLLFPVILFEKVQVEPNHQF